MKRVLSKNNESLTAHHGLRSLPVKRHVLKFSNISIILANTRKFKRTVPGKLG